MFDINDLTFCSGKVFVITGQFSKPRHEYELYIKQNGGKLATSVTKSTDYLLTNDTESGSIKNRKAKELGIPVLTELQFLTLMQRRGN